MKSHNLTSLSAMAAIAAMAASCSQEPLLPIDSTKEEYTKNFINEFGVPAEGHDFAMAVSAGLKVKTAKGGHVTVTAEIDGKEYLFADLNVPAGTHELPVTVPNSVSTVKIKMGFKTFEAGVNDLVDLDTDAPASRAIYANGENYITTGYLTDGIEEPILVFEPSKLLSGFFSKHPVGAHNSTDYYYMGCNTGQGYADTGQGYIDPDVEEHSHVFFGETALGRYGEYFIFPIWWRTNDKGSKKYTLLMHNIYGNIAPMMQLPFNDTDNANNPFPGIKYYTGAPSDFYEENRSDTHETVIDVDGRTKDYTLDVGDFVYDKVEAAMDKFLVSTGDKAYSLNEANVVMTRGIHLKYSGDDSEFGVGFCLASDDGDNEINYSSTIPMWNREIWRDKYFDENLNHLFFPYVSTMQYPLTKLGTSDTTPIQVWMKASAEAEKPYRFSYTTLLYDTAGTSWCNGPFLVGFSSAPSNTADTDTNRDYTDFIMLVVRVTFPNLIYQGDVLPEPFVWTMAVEDLGATDDWDFNDAVFHFTDVIGDLNTVNMNNLVTSVEGPADAVSARVITVWPEATGGTLPIYIAFTGAATHIDMPRWGADKMYSEVNTALYNALNKTAVPGTYVLGTEVHKWLGGSDYTKFINVGDKRTGKTGQSVQFAIPAKTNLSYAEEGVHGSEENKPLYGFSLLVDRENSLRIDAFENGEGLHLLPDAELGKGTYLIGAPDENGSIAPQMLLIADGDGSWEWPTERTKISDAYQGFSDWIANRSNSTWLKSPTEGLVTKK